MIHIAKQDAAGMFPGRLVPFLFSGLSGLLFILSFPKFGHGAIAWIALVPLFHALHLTARTRTAFGLGFIAGLISQAGLLYWISHVIVMYGYLPLYVGISAMFLLCSVLGLYTAVFAAVVVFLRNRGFSEIASAPLAWTALEFMKSHFLTGFPWENLGYSQYHFLSLIQVTDITGVYGLSFVIVLVNVALFDMTLYRHKGKKVLAQAALGGCIILVIFLYGHFSLDRIRDELKTAPAMEVALIQGNIDQSVKWNPQYQEETIDIYKALSLAKAPVGRGLIVWPETATPFFFQDQHALSRLVRNIPKLTSDWLLFGSPSYERDDSQTHYMNSAFLLNPDGTDAGRYDKVHLVPYGEYVPLRKYFPFINKLVEGIGDFRRGKSLKPLWMNDRHALGVLICYEGIFPEISRKYKQNGAGLLVNITNDAWFGKTSAPYQHLSMSVFRAVENRVFLVRAANTGISAFVAPDGKIIRCSALFERTALRESVKFLDRKTLYALYGDVFVYLCLTLLAVIFFSAIKGEIKSCWKTLRRN